MRVFNGACACLAGGCRNAYGAAARDYYAVRTRAYCAPYYGTEIVRILYPVKDYYERLFALFFGKIQYVRYFAIFNARHHCHYALMVARFLPMTEWHAKLVQLFAHNAVHADVIVPRKVDYLPEGTVYLFGHQYLIYAPAAAHSLAHGIAAHYKVGQLILLLVRLRRVLRLLIAGLICGFLALCLIIIFLLGAVVAAFGIVPLFIIRFLLAVLIIRLLLRSPAVVPAVK